VLALTRLERRCRQRWFLLAGLSQVVSPESYLGCFELRIAWICDITAVHRASTTVLRKE
jgi:hypothetical protein